jgi:hypothetical protein
MVIEVISERQRKRSWTVLPTKLSHSKIPQRQSEVCRFEVKGMRHGDSSIGEMLVEEHLEVLPTKLFHCQIPQMRLVVCRF